MLNSKSFNYFVNYENNIDDVYLEPYIIIGSNTYFLEDSNFLQSFEFKQNIVGGDMSTITFSTAKPVIRVGDKVTFFVKNEIRYIGYIDRINLLDEGVEVEVIPQWGKLSQITRYGGLVVEETITIQELVLSLSDLIIAQDIGFFESNIDIPSAYTITTSTMGKTVVEILDECLEYVPAGYIWQVIGGVFYFKLISEIPTDTINWRARDFENAVSEDDYSNIFTQTNVFVKETLNDEEYSRSIGVVGAGGNYPTIPFYDDIGVKMNNYEFNFDVDHDLALDFCYQLLNNQYVPTITEVTNLNWDSKLPLIAQPLYCITTPKRYYTQRFSKTSLTTNTATKTYQRYIGTLYKSLYQNVLTDVYLGFQLSENASYIQACNNSKEVNYIELYYNTIESNVDFFISDGVTSIDFKGSGGVAKLDISKYNLNKREIFIQATNVEYIEYTSLFVTFVESQRVVSGNVRAISYKYDGVKMSVDMTISSIGTVLNGFLFAQNQKVARLEALFREL